MMIFNNLRWLKSAFITLSVNFILLAGTCWAENQNTFTNPTVGFQITKPDSWYYATASQNLENLKRVQFNNSEFQSAIQKYASAPLLIIAKHPEPYEDLNPTLKVTIKPYGSSRGQNPIEILNLLIPQFNGVFKDLTISQSPTDDTIAGIKSAYTRFSYTLITAEGLKFPTTSELWIVPYGDYFFLIGAGTRQDEATGTRAEIQNILKTIIIGR
jgi:hypothetical protein